MAALLRLALPLTLALLASACGFQLRGSADLPENLGTLHLESLDARSGISREMRRLLISSGVEVLDESEPGVYSLGLGREQIVERVISVNSNARAGEYELTMSVPVRLSGPDGEVLGQDVLSLDQVYVADPNNAVAKSEEAEQLAEEMRRELVAQILRRLQAIDP